MKTMIFPDHIKLINPYKPCISPIILWINRSGLFLIYFWFGLLKIVSLSPAEQLVTHLHQITLNQFIAIDKFLIVLGVVECLIGLLWMIPSVTRLAMLLFLGQIAITFLPLILLPEETWNHPIVLSLSGQYIFKNVVLIACSLTIYADCRVKRWKIFRV